MTQRHSSYVVPACKWWLAAILAVMGAPTFAQDHVVVRKPPEGRGLMAPNNGGIWSWGDEILVMYVNGAHKNGTGWGSHSTQEGRPGTIYDTSRSLDGVSGRTNYEVVGPKSLTAYMEMKEIPKPGCFRFPSRAVQTDDGGLTWTLGPVISSLPSCDEGKAYEWDTHPSVVRLDAQTLIATFRSGNQGKKTWTRTGWFDATRSLDNGKTWSHLARLGESPGNNSCPTSTVVVTRPDGGKRVVTLMWLRPPDKKADNRSKLLARYSDDRGDIWSETIVLRVDALGWDTGYPIATARSDGKVVVCYWIKTESQDEPNYIAATIWDAARVDARSPALPR